jgi:hypothetical protein
MVPELCTYIVLAKKRESPSKVQFQDPIAEPDGAVTSDFTFESSLCLCPERHYLSELSQSRWGQRDVEARPLSERSATTHPEAWSGFRARTKLFSRCRHAIRDGRQAPGGGGRVISQQPQFKIAAPVQLALCKLS